MKKRGFNVEEKWLNPNYRGKNCQPYNKYDKNNYHKKVNKNKIIYPEHDNDYLKECIDNLLNKGAVCKNINKYLK